MMGAGSSFIQPSIRPGIGASAGCSTRAAGRPRPAGSGTRRSLRTLCALLPAPSRFQDTRSGWVFWWGVGGVGRGRGWVRQGCRGGSGQAAGRRAAGANAPLQQPGRAHQRAVVGAAADLPGVDELRRGHVRAPEVPGGRAGGRAGGQEQGLAGVALWAGGCCAADVGAESCATCLRKQSLDPLQQPRPRSTRGPGAPAPVLAPGGRGRVLLQPREAPGAAAVEGHLYVGDAAAAAWRGAERGGGEPRHLAVGLG
jgi:hypothetical protein